MFYPNRFGQGSANSDTADRKEGLQSVTFCDGFTVSVGQRVRFCSRRGSEGVGTVTKITDYLHICIQPAADASKGGDWWLLNEEAARLAGRPDYWGPRDSGVSGGCVDRNFGGAA